VRCAGSLARELLQWIGEDPRVTGAGCWVWEGGEQINSRSQLAKLAGEGWFKAEFPNLVGSPSSVVTLKQLRQTLVLIYDPTRERLTFKCERDRAVDGVVVTFSGMPAVGLRGLCSCMSSLQLYVNHCMLECSSGHGCGGGALHDPRRQWRGAGAGGCPSHVHCVASADGVCGHCLGQVWMSGLLGGSMR
jgi:hypothetical protein